MKKHTNKKRSASSRQWLKRQQKDPYVRQARDQGLRSRSAFKLAEMQEKYQCIGPGMTVLDWGAAPGGWSILARDWVGAKGRVIACDLLSIDAIPGVDFIQGDIREQQVQDEIVEKMQGKLADVILSDIAPNFMGVKVADQLMHMGIIESLTLELPRYLNQGGDFVVKVFHGQGFDAYVKCLREVFTKVQSVKPSASRLESREVYLLARGFVGKIESMDSMFRD
jgi:23S rRNA (uridine2552-2'-O)-methyltransferase